MKVYFTLDTLINAGTEKSTLDIVTHFSQNIEVKVIYFYQRHDLKVAYENAGVKLQFLNLKGKYSFFTGIYRLIKVIKKDKPDIIVSSIMRANLISRIACKITRTTIVGTFVNDSYGHIRVNEQKEAAQYRKFRIFWLLDKWTARFCNHWISNAKCIAISNAKALNIDAESIRIIYRGRDAKKIKAWSNNIIDPQKKFRFVFIGRLIQTKGILNLIKAFSIVNKTHFNVHLDIYGAGVLEDKIYKSAIENHVTEKITLHGLVPNAIEKIYEANCFVFPSWSEGFSGSLIEAMLTGIPIIASDIPMNLEAIEHNKTAIVHSVNNPQDLADKMKEMIDQYSQKIEMGVNARLIAQQRFDIKNIATQYEQHLISIYKKTNDSRK
jgi:glycosyltransferase involved in cell wall biosynthesis